MFSGLVMLMARCTSRKLRWMEYATTQAALDSIIRSMTCSQSCSGAYECLERILIYFITLVEIDSLHDVAFKAGVEKY